MTSLVQSVAMPGISFVTGFIFFALDILLLTLTLRWLQHRASLTRAKLVALLLAGKLLLLGGGVYMALAIFAVDILFFTGGALLFLLVLIVWAVLTATS